MWVTVGPRRDTRSSRLHLHVGLWECGDVDVGRLEPSVSLVCLRAFESDVRTHAHMVVWQSFCELHIRSIHLKFFLVCFVYYLEPNPNLYPANKLQLHQH